MIVDDKEELIKGLKFWLFWAVQFTSLNIDFFDQETVRKESYIYYFKLITNIQCVIQCV